jgi:hypothetical protein
MNNDLQQQCPACGDTDDLPNGGLCLQPVCKTRRANRRAEQDPSFAMRRKREEMRERSRKEADAIMALAGFEVRAVWELANQYWPDNPEYDDVRTPWWLFLTEIGPIQIGSRKRVLHIEWSTCAVRAVVTSDDVTKESTYVHAWSVEKAVEYLKALRKAAG